MAVISVSLVLFVVRVEVHVRDEVHVREEVLARPHLLVPVRIEDHQNFAPGRGVAAAEEPVQARAPAG